MREGSFKMRSRGLEDVFQVKLDTHASLLESAMAGTVVKKQSGELEPGDLHFWFPLSPLRSTSLHTIDMVLLVTTDRILAAFEKVPASRRQELDLPATLELHGPIAHEQIIRLSKHLRHDAEYNATQDTNRSPTILSALLCGTKVYVPPPPKKPEPVRVMLAIAAKQAH